MQAERRIWPRVEAVTARVDVQSARSASPIVGILLDCSPGGCRLQAPAAPAVGERVGCALRSPDGNISVSGAVAWRREDRFGAEFGVEVEASQRQALLAIMAACERPMAEPVSLGERVNLHLPGVATPMRARVKRASHGEIVVGSTLQFLSVGVGAIIEEVGRGIMKEARVAHVVVDIDAVTGTPTLLVTLETIGISKGVGCPPEHGFLAPSKNLVRCDSCDS